MPPIARVGAFDIFRDPRDFRSFASLESQMEEKHGKTTPNFNEKDVTREHVETETLELAVVTKSTIEQVIQLLGIENWIKTGLKAAIDGEFCPLDTVLHDGAEIALLPPVSGG